MRAKNFKKYISILVIVNHRNWPDASPSINQRNLPAEMYLHSNFFLYLSSIVGKRMTKI